MAYTKLMGNIAAAPKPNATKYVQIGMYIFLETTIPKSMTVGTRVRAAHSLLSVNLVVLVW